MYVVCCMLDSLVLSTELITKIGHRKEFQSRRFECLSLSVCPSYSLTDAAPKFLWKLIPIYHRVRVVVFAQFRSSISTSILYFMSEVINGKVQNLLRCHQVCLKNFL